MFDAEWQIFLVPTPDDAWLVLRSANSRECWHTDAMHIWGPIESCESISRRHGNAPSTDDEHRRKWSPPPTPPTLPPPPPPSLPPPMRWPPSQGSVGSGGPARESVLPDNVRIMEGGYNRSGTINAWRVCTSKFIGGPPGQGERASFPALPGAFVPTVELRAVCSKKKAPSP